MAPGPDARLPIGTREDVRRIEVGVREAAEVACGALAERLREAPPLEVLRSLKFGHLGREPLDPESPVDLVGQIHRTFYHLVCLRGLEHLLAARPDHRPFLLNPGPLPGPDIVSADGAVAAEALAVLTPVGNGKLAADLARMRASTAAHRYVFYHAERDRGAVEDGEVRVIPVDL